MLPGAWWRAPLGADAETRAAAIAEFVRARYGRRDDLARTRADHRARLARSIDEAARAGAVQMHLSESNDGGIAFATTITEYAVPGAFGTSAEPALLAERVVGALTSGVAGARVDAADPWSAFAAQGGVAFAKGESIVLRRIVRRGTERTGVGAERSDATDGPDGAAETAESITVDYWITVPGSAEVVLVSLSSVLAALEPLMLELFDRIVAAAEWRAAPTLREELAAPRG
ncbi:hypothetical protein ATC03_15365 [Agromyces aureus]|uniref:Uncharacterized protein n=1 Tax=Agromyces aureus TaxID=453304 RepID=A0A191WI95_9MICO|nr:hypothetical protein ATC03_15365 [Agromyces aureus]